MQNPLLSQFDLAPFSKIKSEHFEPAFREALRQAKEEINKITENTATPSFENTIEALEASGEQLNRVASILFNLNSAETSTEIQQIAQQVSPWLSEFSNDLILNETLFARVKSVYETKDSLALSTEQAKLLEESYANFSRNGANLPKDKQEQLRAIDQELAKLSLQFGEHVLAETNNFQLTVLEESKLEGLPDDAKETAAQLAKEKGLEGFLFTLHYPSYLPFMKYVKDRDLRKEMALAFGRKGFQDNANNNEAIVLEVANLRFKRAQLLGYETHAHFVLEQRMAKTPTQVNNFLEDLLNKAKPAATKEFEELSNFAKEQDQIDQLQKWDAAYYAEKLKQKKFDLNEEELKPYFELSNVIKGMFTIAGKLFDLKFEEVDDIDVYHEEVKTYRVTNTEGNFIAVFYADFHPRPGKRDGAWMTVYKNQQITAGENSRPHISIVCNFTRPTATKPSLLTFNEVTTLFHEFGHALHGMLANTTYASLSGTSVYWDFVELPSQLLENWCYEEEALALFAKHYQTGEVIPMHLVEKIKASSNFQEGMQTLRQLSFGRLDMTWHGIDPTSITDVKSHEINAFKGTKFYPDVSENCMSTAFSHIFQGGYSSGYYSYKWAEVLDADAFAYFKEKGIFNKEVAASFKATVLSQGGTIAPMELYKKFRGQEPKPEALLKRAGLLLVEE
ncbi:M3 family metallopeptidase [Psychroflexus maritimus]|uniref:oligopeptidase A n=1 Tax=Psychroflexus maritimus TaxID=2714865 RepID=A0A967AKU7_9FLAO|nr:M3 family metallopeptidase [Psychroflexus maritimus]NGZ90149.1 M3 family metallopeptidase [Psychroflexus maritimus]